MPNPKQILSDGTEPSGPSFPHPESFKKLDNARKIGTGKNAAMFIGILLPLVLFSLLAAQIASGGTLTEEQKVLFLIHDYASPVFDKLAKAISASVATISIAILAIFLWRRVWRTAFFWSIAVGGASLLSTLLKHVFQRTRPHLWTHVSGHATYSFPSGHATLSMALALALLIIFYNTRHHIAIVVASAGFVILVALCRLYLGAHYPTDILASWLLSTAWVIGIARIFHNSHLEYRTWTPR